MIPITFRRNDLGTDPELFLSRNGEIIGSERVIDEAGEDAWWERGFNRSVVGRIVRDGVQLELHPDHIYCRQVLASNIAHHFGSLKKLLPADVKVDFRSVVDVSRAELDALTKESRTLGCGKSENAHQPDATPGVDAETYRVRSAGGHIHLSMGGKPKERVGVVPLLDAIVGNTCVLLDNDPRAAERRQVYGRAGEFRLPSYGLEYRTLSNFWLRSYPIMSFVFNLARLAVLTYEAEQSAEVLKRVDLKKVVHAINKADKEAALENLLRLKDFFLGVKFTGYDQHWVGGNPLDAAAWDNFISIFLSQPIEKWFPQDPMEHWAEISATRDGGYVAESYPGWEKWITQHMPQQYLTLSQAA